MLLVKVFFVGLYFAKRACFVSLNSICMLCSLHSKHCMCLSFAILLCSDHRDFHTFDRDAEAFCRVFSRFTVSAICRRSKKMHQSSGNGSSSSKLKVESQDLASMDVGEDTSVADIACSVCGGKQETDGNAIVLCDAPLDDGRDCQTGQLRTSRSQIVCAGTHQQCMVPPLVDIKSAAWACRSCTVRACVIMF